MIATAFTEPGNWVGVLLRHKDDRNHAYLSLQGRGNVATPRGTVGIITQRSTADFDDFLAYQP